MKNEKLTPQEKQIKAMLPKGKENARESRSIYEPLNLKMRDFRSAIEQMRKKGVPIGASKSRGRTGVFLMQDLAEFNEWASMHQKHAQTMLNEIEQMRNAFAKKNGGKRK